MYELSKCNRGLLGGSDSQDTPEGGVGVGREMLQFMSPERVLLTALRACVSWPDGRKYGNLENMKEA